MRQITFAGLAQKMIAMPTKIEATVAVALKKSAVEVHKTAVAKFGEYQPAVGPYPAWELLTLDTLHQKMDLAGGGADPLIGHYPKGGENSLYPVALRQSLTIEVNESAMTASVGTNDPIAKWQEFGTTKGNVIPPRPFLRPALYESDDYIKRVINEAIAAALFSI